MEANTVRAIEKQQWPESNQIDHDESVTRSLGREWLMIVFIINAVNLA